MKRIVIAAFACVSGNLFSSQDDVIGMIQVRSNLTRVDTAATSTLEE